MHVLVAPNAFKNSLRAQQAAAALADGLKASAFSGRVSVRPVGDGGDGTGELLRLHWGGTLIPAMVRDPLGRPVASQFTLLPDQRTAVIELADASGLRLLRADELDPLRASSAGTGELIARALDLGVTEIILCVGGSATVDGGAGLLGALGARFLNRAGRVLDALPGSLGDLWTLDLSHLDRRVGGACKLSVLCDVVNPLLGVRGAAAVFGPQKGATPSKVLTLEAGLERLSERVQQLTGNPMATLPRGGAAGGVAAALSAVLGAKLVSGIDFFLERTAFDAVLSDADCVITGEGSLDEQTAEGKGPWGVAVRAKARGAFVVGVAGQVPLTPSPILGGAFDVLLPIGHRAMTLDESIASTADNLRRTALQIGNWLERSDCRG
jgi:glycerate kinase